MIKVSCPICDRLMQSQEQAEWPQFPFCSTRCRIIDLGRWLGEAYGVAADAAEELPAELEDANDSP